MGSLDLLVMSACKSEVPDPVLWLAHVGRLTVLQNRSQVRLYLNDHAQAACLQMLCEADPCPLMPMRAVQCKAKHECAPSASSPRPSQRRSTVPA